MYTLPFLPSFIIMSSTIMLLPLMLCPASSPLNNCLSVYVTLFTIHDGIPLVALHNSSTSRPG